MTVTFTCNDAPVGHRELHRRRQTVSDRGREPDRDRHGDRQRRATPSTDPRRSASTRPSPRSRPRATAPPNADGWYNDDVIVTLHLRRRALRRRRPARPHRPSVRARTSRRPAPPPTRPATRRASTESGINIDKTAPTITGAPTTSPDANGWYRGDVTIHWTCSDDALGRRRLPGKTRSIDAERQRPDGRRVGDRPRRQHHRRHQPAGEHRPRPRRLTTSDAPSGWQRNDVTVHFSATDDLSGTTATYFSVDGGAPQTGHERHDHQGGQHRHRVLERGRGRQRRAEAHRRGVHRQGPARRSATRSRRRPNGKGWNNSDVTVTFTCADTRLGHRELLRTEDAHQRGREPERSPAPRPTTRATPRPTVRPSASTRARRRSTAAADRAANAHGWYNADVTVSFTCDDAVSGVDTCPTDQDLGEGKNQKATGTAVDNAGNEATHDARRHQRRQDGSDHQRRADRPPRTVTAGTATTSSSTGAAPTTALGPRRRLPRQQHDHGRGRRRSRPRPASPTRPATAPPDRSRREDRPHRADDQRGCTHGLGERRRHGRAHARPTTSPASSRRTTSSTTATRRPARASRSPRRARTRSSTGASTPPATKRRTTRSRSRSTSRLRRSRSAQAPAGERARLEQHRRHGDVHV